MQSIKERFESLIQQELEYIEIDSFRYKYLLESCVEIAKEDAIAFAKFVEFQCFHIHSMNQEQVDKIYQLYQDSKPK